MLKCRDVPTHAERLLDAGLPFRERLSLHLHLLMCVHCRRYVRQLKLLLGGLARLEQPASDADIQQVLSKLGKHTGDL